MKDRLVFWGKKDDAQKVLITIDLNEDEGSYEVKIMKAENVSEEFDNLVRNQWRNGSDDVVFPEISENFEKELSLTNALLPKEYEVERDDLIKMAQAEWNFLVLSKRLKNTYSHELNELEETIEQLEEFSQDTWNNMKNFWNKVQQQIREKNLARRHGNDIRKRTNELFSNLKELRSKAEESFSKESEKNKAFFEEKLDDIKSKIEDGKSLRHLFEELKQVQKKFKKSNFTKKDQSSIWNKLDGLFKEIKEKKYGKASAGNSPLDKTKRRLDGLKSAIERMEKSISRDKSNLGFQESKIQNADGQLEAQIRKAKLSMIEERIKSKETKLEDMLNTEVQLKKRIVSLEKQEEIDKKEAERKAAEEAVKNRIANEIKESHLEFKSNPKVQKAAEKIGSSKKAKTDNSESKAENAAKIISGVVKASAPNP
ncbi:hypothetical protein [Membranihabitans maritimus]|uniref:hypothetical protein n=1 Tax=Membranihabitans maritimus TaxID=2904244 RepID=UPI001F3D3495|nr:hypothetical protein [Membranihabitans maritimus]